MCVKTIKLIQQLQHSSLHLLLASRVRVVSFCSNCVYLINKDYSWRVLLSSFKELSDKLGTISQILLNQL